MADGLTLRAPAPTGAYLDAFNRALFGGLHERRLQEATDLQSLVRAAQIAKIQREQQEEESRRRSLEAAIFNPADVGTMPPGSAAPAPGLPMPTLVPPGLPAGQPEGAPAVGGMPFSQFVTKTGPGNVAQFIGTPAGAAIMKARGVISDEEYESTRRKVAAAAAVKTMWAEADQLVKDKKPVEAKFLRASAYRKLGEVATDHSERLGYFGRAEELQKAAEELAEKKDEESAYADTMSEIHADAVKIQRDPSDPAALMSVIDKLLGSKSKAAHKQAYALVYDVATKDVKNPKDPDLLEFSKGVMRQYATQPPGSQDMKAAQRVAANEMFRADPERFSRVFYKLTFGDKAHAMFKDLFEMPAASKSMYEEAQSALQAQGINPGHPEFPARSRALVTDLKKERAEAEAAGREAARAERPTKPETERDIFVQLSGLRQDRASIMRDELDENERNRQLRELDTLRSDLIRKYASRRNVELSTERSRDMNQALELARKAWADPVNAKKSDADKKVSVGRTLKAKKLPSEVVERALDLVSLPPGAVNASSIEQVKDAMAKTRFGQPYKQLHEDARSAIDTEFDQATGGVSGGKPVAEMTGHAIGSTTPAGKPAPAPTAAPTPKPAATAPTTADKKAQAMRVMGELFPGRTWEQLTPQEKQQVADRIQ